MKSIIIAAVAYSLGAIVVLLDKYLLKSKRISSPAVYSFYVGLSGLAVFVFAIGGFYVPGLQLNIPQPEFFWWSIISGIFFSAGLLALYWAIHESEASRVTPVVFSVIPLATFALSRMLGNENLSLRALFGAGMLIFGGLLISFDLPLKLGKKKFFNGFYYAIASGIFQAFSLVALKHVYGSLSFFNGFAWSRMGAFVGVCMLFLVPSWRTGIIRSFTHAKKKKKSNAQTAGLFVVNKILGGSSSALINVAIVFGSVTIVSSLISLQYVFVLSFALVASIWLPHIYEERLHFWDWMQKIIAIIIIGIGTFFIS